MRLGHQAATVVHQHHADAAGVQHRQALVNPGVDAARADHHLAGHLGRIQRRRAGEAQARIGSTGQDRVFGTDDWRVAQRRRVHRRAGVLGAIEQSDTAGQETAVIGRCDRRQPRAHVGNGDARAAIAGRRGDEHTGGGCTQKGLLDRVADAGLAATDRVVDHVHAVSHRLVDGRDAVGVEAGVLCTSAVNCGGTDKRIADLVRGNARAWCNARCKAEIGPCEGHWRIAVAARRGRRMRPVPAMAGRSTHRVARRIELRPVLRQSRSQKSLIEETRADQLVVAMTCWIEALARLACARPGRRRPGIGE